MLAEAIPTTDRVPTAEEFRRTLAAVRRFVLAQSDRLAGSENLSHRHLDDYLVFHATRGTLAVVWAAGAVVGVAIAWQTNTRTVLAAARENRDVFDWTPSEPQGDCVYLALVLTTAPGAIRQLANYFLASCPNWRELKQFAQRRGRLVNARRTLQKLAGE